MIDKPTRIGNTELYIVRVQNINVAQSYNVFWEYVEILNKAKKKYKKQLQTKKNYGVYVLETLFLAMFFGFAYFLLLAFT